MWTLNQGMKHFQSPLGCLRNSFICSFVTDILFFLLLLLLALGWRAFSMSSGHFWVFVTWPTQQYAHLLLRPRDQSLL